MGHLAEGNNRPNTKRKPGNRSSEVALPNTSIGFGDESGAKARKGSIGRDGVRSGDLSRTDE
jgi:hypothetical protein